MVRIMPKTTISPLPIPLNLSLTEFKLFESQPLQQQRHTLGVGGVEDFRPSLPLNTCPLYARDRRLAWLPDRLPFTGRKTYTEDKTVYPS